MNKNTGTRTVETTNFAGGVHVTARWDAMFTETAEGVITDYAEIHLTDNLDAHGYREDVEVFEYVLPGLRVTVLVRNGEVETVFTVSDDAAAKFHTAVRKAQPVTVTYVKADGEETVRTIEPTSLSLTKAGDVLIKAADRASGEKRSFRLDRVRTYTLHRTAFLVRMDAPAPSKAELVAAFQARDFAPARTYTVEYRDLREGERVLYEADSECEAAFVKAAARQDAHLELIHASF